MKSELITLSDPKSPVSEAFRTIRTNIMFSSLDAPLKKLLITSPSPNDGKSTIAANLAIVLAQAGKKVLVIDLDLRKPTVHKKFGVENIKGFTNFLLGDAKLEDIVKTVAGIPNLYILTSGPLPPNPAELLGSQKMKKILEQLKDEYDVVVIDSPPVIPVTDAALLASIVDGVVLVLSQGQTRIDVAQKAVEQLKNVGARILGTVLNNVNTNGGSYYYYYYYHYYGEGKKA